jgi:hypothetical protein
LFINKEVFRVESLRKLPRVLQRLTETALILVAVATVVVLIAVAVTDIGLDIPIQFTPDPDAYTLTSDSWGSGTILDGQGLTRFENRDGGLVALFLIAVLVYSVPAVLLLGLLRRFLRAVADGNPFTRENALAMRWIGLIVIIFGLVVQALQSVAAVVAMNTLTTEGIHIEARLTPDFAVVFVGLVVLVLAEAFVHGTNLQADADLTI